MKALILAGGEGTRLRPLTLNTPKPIVPVANIPFLRYQIELLRQHGIRDLILSLSYQPSKIEALLGDGSSLGTRIQYVVERSPLGTAGAFKNAERLLNEATVVFNGDILCELDITEVIRHHQSRKATATLVLTRVENPSAYGLVETASDGRITRFLEKPKPEEITCDTINAGTYVLEPEVLQSIPAGENYSFERGVFPSLLNDRKRMQAYVADGYWIDIGTPQKYLQVHQDLLQRRFRPAVDIVNTPSLQTSVNGRIDPSALLAASVKLGKEVNLVSSSIGEDCVIGDQVLIENAVIWPGVTIGAHSKLTGCIVGRDCRLGHHVTISRGVVLGDQCSVTDYSFVSGEVR
jgi:NDP-sugar pyrophosphorylase family protein